MTTTETTPEAEADVETEAPARVCTNCGAGMEHQQDWCLECGTAVPGRLGGLRPGWRAVSTTLALTLLLVGGAGAASYAALTTDADREAAAGATGPTAVAQVPPAAAVPAPVVPPAEVPPATASVPTVETPAPKLPKVPKGAPLDTPAPAPVAPVVPSVTPPAPRVVPTVPPPTPSTGTATTPRPDDTAAGPRGAGTSAEGESTTGEEALEPIKLQPGAVALYDPYARAVEPGDPALAQDGDPKTTFEFSAVGDDGKPLQVGVVVDLKAVKQVRGLEFRTNTPGGDVEVYGADGSALPLEIVDTRWEHPASRGDVDRGTTGGNEADDGVERIRFPKGGARYRYVTLWFTAPPKGTRRVGLGEITLLR